MDRRQCALTIVLAVIAGFVGGRCSNDLLVDQPVFAQKTPEPQKVVAAEEFRLVDRDGTLRATLGVLQQKPQLLFWEKGNMLGSVYSSRRMELCDEKGRRRFLLGVFLSGGTTLSFIDRDGTIRAMLGQEKDGESGLLLADKIGETKVVLRSKADKGPALQLYEEEGEPRLSLSLVDGKPSLELLDNNGKIIWSAP